jgi:hypothetical protein
MYPFPVWMNQTAAQTHSCGEMSWHCVLFVHSWCAASKHFADLMDQNGMCEWGSFQRQGNEWFAFVILGRKEPLGVASLYLEIAWDHFVITKVANIINFINERFILEGSLQWNKRCQVTTYLAVIMILQLSVDGWPFLKWEALAGRNGIVSHKTDGFEWGWTKPFKF